MQFARLAVLAMNAVTGLASARIGSAPAFAAGCNGPVSPKCKLHAPLQDTGTAACIFGAGLAAAAAIAHLVGIVIGAAANARARFPDDSPRLWLMSSGICLVSGLAQLCAIMSAWRAGRCAVLFGRVDRGLLFRAPAVCAGPEPALDRA
jgi:hypothetical protein